MRRSLSLHLFMFVVTLSALFLVSCKSKSNIQILNNAMEPTLKMNGYYEVKPALLKDLNRGDLVVYRRNNEPAVKRLIGLPGDKVEIREGKTFINGKLLMEDYIENPTNMWNVSVTLNENQYFVLGDNRLTSVDSRVFGPIDGESIYEQVIQPK